MIRRNLVRILWSPTGRLSGIPPWAVLLVLLWIALVLVATLLPQSASPGTICMFRRFTGVPCPTCGGTRAFLSVLDGRLLDAFLLNPLLMLFEILALVWLAAKLVLGRRLSLRLSPVERRVTWAALALVFFLNWAYLILYLP